MRAVVRGQAAFGEEGPGPWQHVERVLNDPTLNGDMRIGASKIIVEYMALYKPEAED